MSLFPSYLESAEGATHASNAFREASLNISMAHCSKGHGHGTHNGEKETISTDTDTHM